MTFENKKILITGAASGIGQAQAKAFLQKGAVVIGIDVNPSTISHENYSHKVGSVTDQSFIQETVAEIADVDILCNTAGVLDEFAPTLETDEALWDRIFNINVKGMYRITNSVLPQMIARQKGIIINMASIAGMIAGGGGAAYTASKHAVIGYTKQLSYDYCKKGIRVNGIAPGAIDTPMNAADFEGDGEMAKSVAAETPAGRWAKPEEVANVTLFLASEESDYMHATIIPIDGGWMNK
ncbi:3-oxoacyl-ACP reductase [Kurthia zopfii]|uniref:3-oxoacyl-ACP reductase n=1 Tax=Kurthia zopfii TaxID=1650 RepID=UPI000F715159|nr:3-oxoacyl-ACP reductase [Kurthia zopfii]VEI05870.1 3-oxoacyl-[acyl-carrier-protein] reductase FabG [Kurthia zopfii]